METAAARKLGNVVVGTDFTRHAHEAVARAMWLPITPGSSVTLVHAIPPGLPEDVQVRLRAAATALMKGAEATARAEAARAGLRSVDLFTVIEVGRPAELVCERARDGRAELVVVGRGERRGVGERLLGSTAERIVRAAPASVLVAARDPEGPYRRPLVAVDFSEASYSALTLAVRTVDTDGKPIGVLHVYDAPYVRMLAEGGMTPTEIDRYVADTEGAQRKQLKGWLPPAGPLLDVQLVRGDPRKTISERAQAVGADLIVVGHHDRTLLGQLILGSVSAAVVRSAPCDVLVAR